LSPIQNRPKVRPVGLIINESNSTFSWTSPGTFSSTSDAALVVKLAAPRTG
jgi:hypothetical protein